MILMDFTRIHRLFGFCFSQLTKYVLNSRRSHCFGNRFGMHRNMNISSNGDLSIDNWNHSAWNLIYFPWIFLQKKQWWLKCFIQHEFPLIFAALWHHFFIRIVASTSWDEKNSRKKMTSNRSLDQGQFANGHYSSLDCVQNCCCIRVVRVNKKSGFNGLCQFPVSFHSIFIQF